MGDEWYGSGRPPQRERPYLRDVYNVAGDRRDQLEGGNIDLSNRPNHMNEDGSVSTVRSMGMNVDGREVLVPTIADDGRLLSDDEAEREYRRTGRKFGAFGSVDASNDYAQRLHLQQESNKPGGDYGPQRLGRKEYGDLITTLLGVR